MSFGGLLLLYLLVGVGVGGAAYLSGPRTGDSISALQVLMALFFWPLFLPLLLAGRGDTADRSSSPSGYPTPVDELARLIGQVNAELDGALHSLDGWAEGVLAREKDRLTELRGAWNAQADRIREMDRLLKRPEF